MHTINSTKQKLNAINKEILRYVQNDTIASP